VKVIVDSCVWSLMLRRRRNAKLSREELLIRDSLAEAIADGRVAIIGPIRQEVLSGIKDPVQFANLQAALSVFRDEPLTTSHFEEAARLYNLCRSRGVECSSTDILICAVAVEKQWSLLTNDMGLLRCIRELHAEGFNL
jgi:predicted nucleic acid-binding protein